MNKYVLIEDPVAVLLNLLKIDLQYGVKPRDVCGFAHFRFLPFYVLVYLGSSKFDQLIL